MDMVSLQADILFNWFPDNEQMRSEHKKIPTPLSTQPNIRPLQNSDNLNGTEDNSAFDSMHWGLLVWPCDGDWIE
jgi:hypothetical protein